MNDRESTAPVLTKRAMKLLVLRAVSTATRQEVHKYNLLGRGEYGDYALGDLERIVGSRFDRATRRLADEAFESLKSAGLLACTYSDNVNPEMWVTITDAGRTALVNSALDPLDDALHELGPYLVEMREGMHRAIESDQPDSARQAAHSARELLTQVLQIEAPNDEVRSQDWFVPNKEAHAGVTRKARARLALQKRYNYVDDADIDALDALICLVDASYRRLSGRAHDHKAPARSDVAATIADAERALAILLLKQP
jgi:hypothetical protein